MSTKKVMVSVVFCFFFLFFGGVGDSKEVLSVDYPAKYQTVTNAYGVNLFRQVQEKIKKTQRVKMALRVLFSKKQSIISVLAFAAIQKLVEHAIFSSDLPPSDFKKKKKKKKIAQLSPFWNWQWRYLFSEP